MIYLFWWKVTCIFPLESFWEILRNFLFIKKKICYNFGTIGVSLIVLLLWVNCLQYFKFWEGNETPSLRNFFKTSLGPNFSKQHFRPILGKFGVSLVLLFISVKRTHIRNFEFWNRKIVFVISNSELKKILFRPNF